MTDALTQDGGLCTGTSDAAPGAFPRVVQVTCPWPDPKLSPNARVNRMQRAALVRHFRMACADAAAEAGVSPATGSWTLQALIFAPPDGRAHDEDNLIGRFKAGQDGLADAAGANDRDWHPQRWIGAPEPGGAVIAIMRNDDIPG